MRRVVRIHFAMRRVVLLLCAVLQANGFHAAPPPQRPSTLLRASPLSSIPVGSIVLGALAIGSVGDLVVEVPKLGGEGADYIGTLLDAAFLGYATKTLGAQSGLLADAAPAATVEGLELCVSLSVGREDGTWMPRTGPRPARDSCCRSTSAEDGADLGFPGEEALGGRFCRRLSCDGGSFVGRDGRVEVACSGGGWSAAPTGRPGEFALRFFLDFPSAVARNDVEIPAGRVFLSSAAFFDADLDKDMAVRIPPGDVVEAPSGCGRPSGGLPGGMASLMEANDAGFGCDLALWEPVRLTAAVDGLAVGTAGVVVGWTGEAYRVAPSCITARERPVVARPEELAPRERPPIAGAEALERTPVVPIFGEAPSVERALDLYAQAGARGSADALYALGVLRYARWTPPPRDYGAAAELGHEGAMLCLYDALGDGDADGDEWLHHSAFLGDAPRSRGAARARKPRAVVAERARLVARVGALERARKDARLAPRKPAASGARRWAPSPARAAAPPGDRPASRPQPGAGRRKGTRTRRRAPRASARLRRGL
ncbi:hypothetical protein JL720_6185 [Aureococcus anophagefferens]|nr:hypothetical protein JL720_6185 [Aureococcus anophagefferens]